MGLLESRALVLRVFDYSETSQVVWFFTRSHGRLHAIAKGSRRARSELEGALEPFVLGDIEVYRKEKRELDILKDMSLLDLRLPLRRSYDRIVWATHIAELLTETVQLDDPNPEFFDLTEQVLNVVTRAPLAQIPAWVLAFEGRLLKSLGVFPSLDVCVETGSELTGDELFFDPLRGGVVAPSVARGAPRIRRRTLDAFRHLSEAERPLDLDLDRRTALGLRALLDDTWKAVLEKPLRLGKSVEAVLLEG